MPPPKLPAVTSPVGIHWASKKLAMFWPHRYFMIVTCDILHYVELSIYDNFKYCLAFNSTIFFRICSSAYPSEIWTTGFTCCRKHSNSWRSFSSSLGKDGFHGLLCGQNTVIAHCLLCSSVLYFPKGPLMNRELNPHLFQTLNNKDIWASSQFHHAFRYV